MENLTVVIVLYAGITHALEADHVLAVSNIVSQRKAVLSAVKDGIFWGLGHTSTLLLVGLIVLVFKSAISEETFYYFEAAVGLMLIIVAVLRLIKLCRMRKSPKHSGRTVHSTSVPAIHVHPSAGALNLHKVSYGIGLVHGLAGSGALLVLATTQVKETSSGMIYLLLYGLGSVMGMAVVSGLFSIPFSKRLINNQALRTILTLISSGICVVYGVYVVYENLHR